MLWYRETERWAREDWRGHPLEHPVLRPKAGTKWHLVDPVLSDGDIVVSVCDPGLGGKRARRATVLLDWTFEVPRGVLPEMTSES
jgi:hypothetical protein